MIGFFRKYYVLQFISLLAAVGLCVLSYLTILDYFKKNEEQFIISCNDEVIDEITTSLKYGKTLSNYYGISDVLKRAALLLNEGSIIVLANKDEEAIASTMEESYFQLERSDYGEVIQEIRSNEDGLEGYLKTYYSYIKIKEELKDSLKKSVIGSLIVFLIMTICCFAGYKKGVSDNHIVLLMILGVTIQGIFLTVNYRPEFEKAAQKSAEGTAAYVNSTINDVLKKGVVIEEIYDLDEYMEEKRQENDSIASLYIKERNDSVRQNEYTLPLYGENEKRTLAYSISEGYIHRNVLDMALTFIATIVLAIIVMKESIILSDMISFRRSKLFGQPSEDQYKHIANAIRYGNFLSVTFDYMCLSFSALQIKEWNQGTLGMSPITAAALSISICSIADLLGMFFMPYIGKRLAGKKLTVISAIVMIVANLGCFFTTSTLVMVIMRFFAGVGTAGVKQVRNIVISDGYSCEKERSANLAASNNGVIGGILCGMGFGGVIAGVFGYQTTFIATAIGYMLYLIFMFLFMPWKLLLNASNEKEKISNDNFIIRLNKTITSKRLLKTICLVIIPQYFLLMIIVCLIPGRIQSLRLPGVVLTYANLLNGVAGLYLGERVYKLLQNKFKSDITIQMLVLVTGAVSMIMLNIPFFMTAVIILSSILAGLVDGIGTPVSMDIYMGNISVIEGLDDTESLVLYSVLGSAVMSVAPFILELCEKNEVWMFGSGIYLIICAILMIRGKKQKKRQ